MSIQSLYVANKGILKNNDILLKVIKNAIQRSFETL
jgi:hypothetical protein